MPDVRQLALAEACRVLGISRRTAQRRLADGTLTGVKVGSRWLVDVALPETDAPEASARAALVAEVETLRAQMTELRQERDYLRQALAVALSKLPTPAPLLPERAETPGRSWLRWPWGR